MMLLRRLLAAALMLVLVAGFVPAPGSATGEEHACVCGLKQESAGCCCALGAAADAAVAADSGRTVKIAGSLRAGGPEVESPLCPGGRGLPVSRLSVDGLGGTGRSDAVPHRPDQGRVVSRTTIAPCGPLSAQPSPRGPPPIS